MPDLRTISARQAWAMSQESSTAEGLLFRAIGWVGTFQMSKGWAYFNCPEGCCEDYWEGLDAFLDSHDASRFYAAASIDQPMARS